MAFDLHQLADLLPLAVGALKPGSPESAAFMRGWSQAQQRLQQEQIQQHQVQGQDQLRQAQIQNLEADNQRANRGEVRAEDQAALQRLTQALGAFRPEVASQTETATDPTQAENALLQRSGQIESAYGLKPAALAGFVPSMAAPISARRKKRAQQLYDQAEKRFGPEAMAGDSITLQTEEFGNIKPAALRAMFEAPAVTASGTPAIPETGKRTPAVPGSFEDYLTADPGRQAGILTARKAYTSADNQPSASNEPIAPEDVQGAAVAILSGRMAPSQLSLVGGMGNRGVKFKQAVVAEVNKRDPQFNWQASEAGYKFASAPGTQTTIRFLNNIEKTLPVLEKASADFKRSGVRIINRATLAAKSQFGDTSVTTFEFARNILADEIAKILQGGGTGNGTSDAKLRQAQDLLASDMTPAQFDAALAAAKELLGMRKVSLTEGTFLDATPGAKTPAADTSDRYDRYKAARRP